jgi:hypothetical protein
LANTRIVALKTMKTEGRGDDTLRNSSSSHKDTLRISYRRGPLLSIPLKTLLRCACDALDGICVMETRRS